MKSGAIRTPYREHGTGGSPAIFVLEIFAVMYYYIK